MRSRVLVALLALSLGTGGTAPALAQSGSAGLSGTVTTDAGEPLAGVCVDVHGESTFHSVVTGSDGRYQVDGLETGQHLVAFNFCEEPLPGYAGEFYDDARRPDTATPVELSRGEQASGIDAALSPAAQIHGTVVDDTTGAGLAGICVSTYDQRTGVFGQARTDADGSYALASLRGGDYQLYFSDCAAPYHHLPEAYDDVSVDGFGHAEPTTVSVADGEVVEGVDAGLREGGSVTGSVTALHNGEPVNYLCVGMVPADGTDDEWPHSFGTTGFAPDGTPTPGDYVVTSVPPGDYHLGFNPVEFCGDDGYATQWYDGERGRSDAQELTVVAGETLGGVDAVVAPRPSTSVACGFFGHEPSQPAFSDVPDGNLHAGSIDCLAARGVLSGRGDGTYGPAEDVRRDQMATLVIGALKALDVALPDNPADAFVDDEGSVHERAIDQLAALGVVSGTGDRRFLPLGTVTRAQMATFLVRAYEQATGFSLRAVEDGFHDDDGYTHEERINKARTAGLAVGTSTTTYDPLGSVRRDQVATFLARLLDRVQRDRPYEGFHGPFPGPAPAPAPAPGAEPAPALVARSAGEAELLRLGVLPDAAER